MLLSKFSGSQPLPGKSKTLLGVSLTCVGLFFLAGCTIEPLNASRPSTQIGSQSTQEILAATTVNKVGTRVAQQVRNNLLFAMNGGSLQPGGRYYVVLNVTSKSRSVAVENSSLAPTSSQLAMSVNYEMFERSTRKSITKGVRRSLAGYDRTPQSFANERAKRDAENRAAKDVAIQIRLALAQAIADL